MRKYERVQFTLTGDAVDKLKEKAKMHGLSLGQMAKKIVQEHK